MVGYLAEARQEAAFRFLEAAREFEKSLTDQTMLENETYFAALGKKIQESIDSSDVTPESIAQDLEMVQAPEYQSALLISFFPMLKAIIGPVANGMIV